jgi:hypothetical protein
MYLSAVNSILMGKDYRWDVELWLNWLRLARSCRIVIRQYINTADIPIDHYSLSPIQTLRSVGPSLFSLKRSVEERFVQTTVGSLRRLLRIQGITMLKAILSPLSAWKQAAHRCLKKMLYTGRLYPLRQPSIFNAWYTMRYMGYAASIPRLFLPVLARTSDWNANRT